MRTSEAWAAIHQLDNDRGEATMKIMRDAVEIIKDMPVRPNR